MMYVYNLSQLSRLLLDSSIAGFFVKYLRREGKSGVIFACLAHMKVPFMAEQPYVLILHGKTQNKKKYTMDLRIYFLMKT